MPIWNRDYRDRDLGDRARSLANRAGEAVRRGVERLRGEDEYRGDWDRYHGREDRWGRDRFGVTRPRSDLGDQDHPRFARGMDERSLTYRGIPGGDVRGGMGRRYGAIDRDEPGWGSVHYDRDYGYGAYGAIRDRGFEAYPHDTGGRGYRGSGDRYDREMRGGMSYDDLADQTWSPRMRGRGWEGGGRTPSGYEPSQWRERPDRGGGMTPGWRGDADRAFDEYRGYAHGPGDEPYYGREDFRGRDDFRGREPVRYDRDFEGDWF
jgi:hypothetical protein